MENIYVNGEQLTRLDVVEFGGAITLDDELLHTSISGEIAELVKSLWESQRGVVAAACKVYFASLSYGKQNRAKRKIGHKWWCLYLMSLDADEE